MTGWPWPLESVQGFFEGLWRGIVDAISTAGQWLWQKIHDGLSWLWENITSGLAWLWERVSEGLSWLGERVSSGLAWLWGRLQEIASSIVNAVLGAIPALGEAFRNFVSLIVEPIKAGLDWLLARIGEILTPIREAIQSGIHWLLERMQEIFTPVISNIQAGLEWLSRAVADNINALGASLLNTLGNVLGTLQSGLAGIASTVTSVAGVITENVTASARWVYESLIEWADGVMRGIAQAISELPKPFWITGVEQISQWLDSRFLQAIYNLGLAQTVATHTALQLSGTLGATRSKRDPLEAYRIMNTIIDNARGMWAGQFAAALAVEAATLGQLDVVPSRLFDSPDVKAIMNAYMRVLDIAMSAQLYEPLRLAFNYTFTPAMPSPQDMIQFMVKEAFYPEKQVELPGQFVDWMRYLGYSEEWTRLFWGAHWRLPSTTEVFTMLHRKLITPEFVDAYLKLADIEPSWRPLLRAISYELPDRIRTRWMYEWGLIDLQTWQLLDEYSGLHPQWSGLMVQAELRNILRDDINAVRSELHRQAREGLISLAEYEAYLRQLGLPEPVIQLRVDAARLARDTDARIEMVKAIRQAYVDKKIDPASYSESLARLGVSPDALAVFTQVDGLKREPKPIPPETTEKKIADLQDRIRKYELSLQQAHEDLQAMQSQMAEELGVLDAELQKKLADLDDRLRLLQARWQFIRTDREAAILRTEAENLLAEKAQLQQLYAERYDAAQARWQTRILQQQQKIREIELELAIMRERLARLVGKAPTTAS